MGPRGSIVVRGFVKGRFLRAFTPFMLELPSCHSPLMSSVLFQEHIANCHRCVTQWVWKTERKGCWLCEGQVKILVHSAYLSDLECVRNDRKTQNYERKLETIS